MLLVACKGSSEDLVLRATGPTQTNDKGAERYKNERFEFSASSKEVELASGGLFDDFKIFAFNENIIFLCFA